MHGRLLPADKPGLYEFAEKRSDQGKMGTKKNDEGRHFYFTGELQQLLEGQKEKADQLELRGILCPQVFQYRNGKPNKEFTRNWHTACRRLFLAVSLTISGGRRLGTSFEQGYRLVAMKMTGSETRSVFEQYNSVRDADLKEASRRLGLFTGTITGTVAIASPTRSPQVVDSKRVRL